MVKFRFRLYIAGETQNSMQALANLSSLCQMYLVDRYEIELVDVFREPKRALEDHILMTPTLVKLEPSPSSRIIGTLSQATLVLQSLGLAGGSL
jgi:circadian clock protein KaiB